MRHGQRVGRTDFLMLLAVLFWALNFSAVKGALKEFSPHGFNGPRLALASILLLVYLRRKEGPRSLCRSDILRIIVLGAIGNALYQALFIRGISLTSASRASLVMTMTPIIIALLSVLFLGERLCGLGWAGILLSCFGLCLVIIPSGPLLSFSGESFKGDLLILLCDLSWAVYSVFSKPLLEKMSPLRLTALTLAAGTMFYLPLTMKAILALPRAMPSPASWAALLYSSVFAIAVSYVIWYSSVRRIGNARTGIFTNIAPALSVLFARIVLSESITPRQAVGAIIILVGFSLARPFSRPLKARGQPANRRPEASLQERPF